MAICQTLQSQFRSNFSRTIRPLLTLGPKVQDAIEKIPGVVDTQNGIDNTVSGPATNFQISPVLAGRLGFTPTEAAEDATAIVDGLPTTDPLIVSWQAVYHSRAAARRQSSVA